MKLGSLTLAFALMAGLSFHASSAQAATFEVVARTGADAALGFIDAQSGTPTGGRITRSGAASAFITLTGPSITSATDEVLARWGFGGGPAATLDFVAREGDLVSFTPNLPVRSFGVSLRELDASGRALFGAISDNGVSALWLQDSISETALSVLGAPCTDAVGHYQQGNPAGTVLMNADGLAVFSECNGLVFATSLGRTEVELPASWPAGDGGAPLVPPTLMALGDDGRAWVDARVACAACPEGMGGGLFTVAQSGTVELAFDINAHTTVAPILAPTQWVLDSNGHIAGLARSSDASTFNDLVVFRFNGTTASVLARVGDAAMDNPGNPIASFAVWPSSDNVWLTDSGDVVFSAQLTSPPSRALLRSDGGVISTLLVAGQDAGVMASGTTLIMPGFTVVSSTGRVAAMGDLQVPGVGVVPALWLSDEDGSMSVQLHVGQTVTLDDDTTAQVLAIGLPHAPAIPGVGTGHGGRGVPLADDGSVLMTLSPSPLGSADLLVKVTPSAPLPPQEGVSLTLSGPVDPIPNQNGFTLSATVNNESLDTRDGELLFTVQSGTLRMNGEVPGCTPSEEAIGVVEVQCLMSFLPDVNVITLPLFVAGTEAITIDATVTIGDGTDTATYTNTIAEDVADLEIRWQEGTEDRDPGSLIVTNLGPNTAYDLVVTYPSDPLLNEDCASGCVLTGMMLSGESSTVVLARGSSQSGRLRMTASVTSSTPDPDITNNQVAVDVTLQGEVNSPLGGTCTCAGSAPGDLVIPSGALLALWLGRRRRRAAIAAAGS